MPEYLAPGVYVEERRDPPAITGVDRRLCLAIVAGGAPEVSEIGARLELAALLPGIDPAALPPGPVHVARAGRLDLALDALLDLDSVGLVAAPGLDAATSLIAHVARSPSRFALIDPPRGLDPSAVRAFRDAHASPRAALYWPWGVGDGGRAVPPSIMAAGVIARSDVRHGIARAPAGDDAVVAGVARLDSEAGSTDRAGLNAKHVNLIRTVRDRIVVWGARTLSHDPEDRYVPVRRLRDWIAASVATSLAWTALETSDAQLRALVRANVENFLAGIWRDGGLQGSTPDEAFFVRCDATTTSAADLAAGRLVLLYGIAPLRPAEFLIDRIILRTAA